MASGQTDKKLNEERAEYGSTATVSREPNAQTGDAWDIGRVFVVVVISAFYIIASATLILFNNYLMQPSRFPYAWVLTGWHIVVTFSCCAFMYVVCPGLFPSSMVARDNIALVSQWFPCIAILFTFGAVLSNTAYMHCSVPFLQFMKEWNVGFVFIMSVMIGTQAANRVKVSVIVWIIAFASMSVTGEKKFSNIGFMIQLASQFCETTKAVFQEWIMGGRLKLDPLTYQLCMCPFAIVPLAVGIVVMWDRDIEHQAMIWWPYLIVNGFCAFLLNISIAAIIKYAGAVGFLLAAIVKDICIVLLSTRLNGDTLEHLQILGFILSLAGILYWGLLSASPDSRLVTWLPKLLNMPQPQDKGATSETDKKSKP